MASSTSHFTRIQAFKSDYSPTSFAQYESQRTGMRVVVIDQKGPKVNGYFTLATEIHDDSGAPHTLEHLCFMGSRNYSYKGFLDKLASRFYSDTNAWTDTDNTSYTLDSAGWASFSKILPLYLEHIIAPTLTDEGCYTEVYHVDGTGQDAGVVYSEMQGVQNDATELIDLKIRRLMYPERVGYRYETGGMMEALRVLTPERIRQFHRLMYQPKNLCLIITGEVDHADMLRVLDEFESSILDVIPPPDATFNRPWVNTQPPHLTKSIVETVEFPEEDEDFGEIEIRFLGPDTNDIVSSTALQVVLNYLAGSSASVLENVLVEKEQLCTAVYYSTEDQPKTEIQFTLTSVKTSKLHEVEKRFFEVLKEAMASQLDLPYMFECLQRHKRTWKYSTESSPATFSQVAIVDFIYGKKDGSTLTPVGSLQEFDVLAAWGETEWKTFIQRWLSEAHHVSVLGIPSLKLSKKLKTADKERIEKRRKDLGPEGLKALEEKLKQATETNGREIPREDLLKFKVPGVETIPFIHTMTARSGAALNLGRGENRVQEVVDADGSADHPLYIQFEHIPSNFVHITLYLSTEGVSTELKPLLSVYTEAFFSLPLNINGKIMKFEHVVGALERVTVGYGFEDPLSHAPELLAISFQVEVESYQVAILWLKALTWDSIFDIDRLKSITSRLLSDIPESKRSGSSMLSAVKKVVEQTPESILRARSTLVKARYLKAIKSLLKTSPEAVVARMEQIRSQLFQFQNMRVLVVADLDKLIKPVSSWTTFEQVLEVKESVKPIVKLHERLTDAAKNPGTMAYIVPLPPLDSSYLSSTTRGISSWDDPKLPALMVAIAFMNLVEGPMWVAVRGTGLAYGASLHHKVASGLVTLDIWRSPNAGKAFRAAKETVKNYISGVIPLDAVLALEGAISHIVVGFVNDQSTYAMAAQANFNTQVVSELPSDHMEQTLRKTRDCTVEDVKMALREFIMPLFEPDTANVVMTCASSLEQPLKSTFEDEGFKPEVRPLKEFEDDYGLKIEDEGEESTDDDDEETDEEGSSGSDAEDETDGESDDDSGGESTTLPIREDK
ncbi:hypothetical protein KEM56_004575 [Ascosphaera pollenicola]|nr:hypothetical protein KEM56_004575 [Ascosphaera pollenicola]